MDLNNVGTWSSGAKVICIKPSDCYYDESNNYQSCQWMAELKDIRGTQHCIEVTGYSSDGDRGYNLNGASCRWKNEINC